MSGRITGADGSGYYSDGQVVEPYAPPPSTIFFGSGPYGPGWYEDSTVTTGVFWSNE